MLPGSPFHTECLNVVELVSSLKTFSVLGLEAGYSVLSISRYYIRKELFVELLKSP